MLGLVTAQVFLSLRWVGAPLLLQCAGFSLRWLHFSGASVRASGVAAQGLGTWGPGALEHRLNNGLSCSVAWGIFPDQGLNPCLLHWLADSLPLSPREAPFSFFSICLFIFGCTGSSLLRVGTPLWLWCSGFSLWCFLLLLSTDPRVLRCSCPSGAGSKYVSPALAGRFFTAGSPGRSWARHS